MDNELKLIVKPSLVMVYPNTAIHAPLRAGWVRLLRVAITGATKELADPAIPILIWGIRQWTT